MAYLLTQLLSESAKLYPEKPAVWARGRTLSYRELEEKSNQLAHLLRERGVKEGDRIGLCFPKAVESIVCMFGVMKAGGVYVPLDPAAPTQRIAYIIGDCGVTGLISTCEKLTGLEPAGIDSVKFKIATDAYVNGNPCSDAIHWSTLAKFPASCAPVNESVTTDLAYILYTSGSTGRPKGVMLSHLNALTFVEWCAETFQIRPEDRLSNHAPHHFDLSVFDIYNTIKAGATVYMIPDEVSLFPASLAKFIDEQGITVWYSVPSALVYLVLHGNLKGRDLQGLRTILFAGEVFAMKYLRQLAEFLPNAGLYNLYGPTETNVCTYYEVERERLGSMKNIPIGKACANTQVFAVNDRDEIAKPGEEGELWVRGPSVTPGYWGDPEKTKRGVVVNRFQPHFEEKAYRTGDLVTLEADGNYYYVGRRDSMIKSRGYRIELGEIEAALLSHPGVMEAAAVAVPDEEIGSRIKAIVAPHDSHKLTTVELQQHCASRIPKYMIPELIELLPSLPKTSTGKLDRVQLAQRPASPVA